MSHFTRKILMIDREDKLKGEFVTAILDDQNNNATESHTVIELEMIQG